MQPRANEFGQPIGPALPEWKGVPRPALSVLEGRTVRVEALSAERHAEELFEAFQLDEEGQLWTYLAYGPFADCEALGRWIEELCASPEAISFALIEKESGRARGFCSYLRVYPEVGSIEIGNVKFSLPLRGTPAATEAMHLLMKHAFELGYRRYEWKCDALNEPSRRAAARLGFRYEGTFRNALVYKERSRDTAWFSITCEEWPAIAALHERWLAPSNFDSAGQQLGRLSKWTADL